MSAEPSLDYYTHITPVHPLLKQCLNIDISQMEKIHPIHINFLFPRDKTVVNRSVFRITPNHRRSAEDW